MRIIHIIPSLKKGGAERLALDICIELSKRQGIDVALIVLDSNNDYKELSAKINYHAIPARFTPSIKGKATIDVNALMKFIESFKPDVIHSHLFEADLVSRVHIFKGIKYFSHCHDNMHQLQKFTLKTLFSKKLLTEYYERLLILKKYKECNNTFIVISRHTEAYFRAVLPTSFSNKIHLLHNAINYSFFHDAFVGAKALQSIRLVNCGSFVKKKNQQFLVDVVKQLKNKGLDVSITMLGDGELKESVAKKAEEAGLSNYIHLPGNVENVGMYLSDANIYIHVATYEPFGLVLLEAMAAGLPVITLDGKGNRDLIEEGKNGYMIYEENPDLFVEKIIELWDNKEKYNQMSKYVKVFAKHYDIKAYTNRLLEIYNKPQ